MVTNAKRYNDKNSNIFADAERIRKMLSNTMPKINPAYKDPKYTAVPTPLPEEVSENGDHVEPDGEPDQEEDPASPQASQAAEGEEESFDGDSIQQAQDKILSEMIHLKDPEYVKSTCRFFDPSKSTANSSQRARSRVSIYQQTGQGLIQRLLRFHSAPGVAAEHPKTSSWNRREKAS